MPDPLIREIPLIQRYSRHNHGEDYRFRAYVKQGLELSNAQLDAIVKETGESVSRQIDCTTCANCCKTLGIVVDAQDVQRIATRLGITPAQFSLRYVSVQPDGARCFNAVPCPFLGKNNRCVIYEDRPQACRQYPFVQLPGFRSRSLTMVENVGVCPIVFNVWQALKKRLQGGKR